MKAYARIDGILNVGYFSNGLSISDVKFANSMSLRRQLNGCLNVKYILNGFKWSLSLRCHCHLVEYRSMPEGY